ncbi:MAG TPA: hypothetical protein VGS19_34370 [Streptosporangiaceae bacterium]|nr:hypothetical protein [Streptosporangiaceae bacterium]
MKEDIYPYDAQLYDRSFLNCYQRQAVVKLAERVPDLHLLFYTCLISVDEISEHMFRRNLPKYDFRGEVFAPDVLARIGITRKDEPFDTYADAKPALLDAVANQGYAIPWIDVFYLPHTPEYYKEHVVHTVTLTDYDPGTGQWSLLDDNRASVLCRYSYPEAVIAAAYDNNKLRRLSWFPTSEYDAGQARRGAIDAFAGRVEQYKDSHALLTGVSDLLASPWFEPRRAFSLLYDTFSLFEGSRTCLREYLARQPGYAAAVPATADVAQRCRDIRNQLMIGRATGRVDQAWLTSACLELAGADDDLVSRLGQGPDGE